MFFKVFFFIQFFSVTLFAQNLPDSIELDSGKMKLYALTNHQTLIRPQVYSALVSYLDSQKLPLKNYYVDSKSNYVSDTLYVEIWDKVGIMTIQRIEKINDSLSRVELTGRRKVKYPKPVGNPGNCFTLIYDLKRKRLIDIEYWQ